MRRNHRLRDDSARGVEHRELGVRPTNIHTDLIRISRHPNQSPIFMVNS
jgi:hypothetical protein